MRKKPTSTRRERAKRVVRDLSSRGAKSRATRGGAEVMVETLIIAHEGLQPATIRGTVQRVAVALPCER